MGSTAPSQHDTYAGRRRHSRLRLHLPARLVTLDGIFQATLVDLSFKGAKIMLRGEVRPGGDAELAWGTYEVFCSIIWNDDGLCGLKFEEPLAPHVLIATRDFADETPQLDIRRATAQAFVRGTIRL
jgi:PilZ domain